MNTDVMFSSQSAEWETPQGLFNWLNRVFEFGLDVCATRNNTKCEHYYDQQQDGLSQVWSGTCWMNPPYGRGIGKWIKKASESAEAGATVVALLPARTDTQWFHTYIYCRPSVTIYFLSGRLKFGGHKNAAPFPSMIVVFLGAFNGLSRAGIDRVTGDERATRKTGAARDAPAFLAT